MSAAPYAAPTLSDLLSGTQPFTTESPPVIPASPAAVQAPTHGVIVGQPRRGRGVVVTDVQANVNTEIDVHAIRDPALAKQALTRKADPPPVPAGDPVLALRQMESGARLGRPFVSHPGRAGGANADEGFSRQAAPAATAYQPMPVGDVIPPPTQRLLFSMPEFEDIEAAYHHVILLPAHLVLVLDVRGRGLVRFMPANPTQTLVVQAADQDVVLFTRPTGVVFMHASTEFCVLAVTRAIPTAQYEAEQAALLAPAAPPLVPKAAASRPGSTLAPAEGPPAVAAGNPPGPGFGPDLGSALDALLSSRNG